MKKRIAIPLDGEQFTSHFGHCTHFAFIETEDGQILSKQTVLAPEHKPGAFPKFLVQQKTDVVLAGGMGERAQKVFAHHGVEVLTGIQQTGLEEMVNQYLNGTIETSAHSCHSHEHHHHHNN